MNYEFWRCRIVFNNFHLDPHQGPNIGQRIVRGGQELANQNVRIIGAPGMVRPTLIPATVCDSAATSSEASEIPDNVTAELEKLEQEGAPMVEVEGVSAILGDLGDDDDDMLGKFAILKFVRDIAVSNRNRNAMSFKNSETLVFSESRSPP